MVPVRLMTAWFVGAALLLLAACDQLPASGRAAVELDSALLIEGQAPEQPVSLPNLVSNNFSYVREEVSR